MRESQVINGLIPRSCEVHLSHISLKSGKRPLTLHRKLRLSSKPSLVASLLPQLRSKKFITYHTERENYAGKH